MAKQLEEIDGRYVVDGKVLTDKDIWRLLDLEFSRNSGEFLTNGGWFLPQNGVEDQGDTPGVNFGHDAYTRLRQFAWRYRNARNDELCVHLEVAMETIAKWIKARPGVKPEDVDHVMACLMANRCGCERCRYGM